MQTYAALFLTAALSSACFIDSGVKDSVAFIGRWSLGIFSALFVVTEIAALVS